MAQMLHISYFINCNKQNITELLGRIIEENGCHDCLLDIKRGSDVGDDFLSELSCIIICDNGSDKVLDILCKVAPLNENRRKEFFPDVALDCESYFNNKLMPIKQVIFSLFRKVI